MTQRLDITNPATRTAHLPIACYCGVDVDDHEWVDLSIGMIVGCSLDG